MTVAEFIELLMTYPQDIQVALRIYSEHCLVEEKDLTLIEACKPRDDGWIHDKRPDKESQTYLRIIGN